MHETERSDPFTEGRRSEALRLRAFRLFWSATTIRAFGTSIAGVAFQVLIVTVVAATPFQIGILSALSVAPYLFLGLIVGALMDRWNRQRTLVLTSIGRALVLATVPVLLLLERLDFWSLAAVILTLGVLTLFAFEAIIHANSAILQLRLRAVEPVPLRTQRAVTSQVAGGRTGPVRSFDMRTADRHASRTSRTSTNVVSAAKIPPVGIRGGSIGAREDPD